MRTRASLFTILALLNACCLDWSQALFFKSWKKGVGYGGVQSYGNNYFGNYGYGNSGYGVNGYGNSGYGNYAGGYGYNYPSYPSYSSYSYPSRGRRPSGKRTGRTYSEIARVLKPDGYVGLGGSRFLPNKAGGFSPLWG
ncbi:hypothetical protein KR009_005007 [Drosophila setifemur]|nr:hypothetical protein KR009_005007 [Drosophila setifemur]